MYLRKESLPLEEDRSYLIENARSRLYAEQSENDRRRKAIEERVRNGSQDRPALIPAKPAVSAMDSDKTLRVAAYCRVSTDAVEQETSYELQKEHFESLIRMHPNWRLAGIYADKGKSGTNTRHRDSFRKLIDDCYAGKIDLVVTRAVSRFARNLLDCLNYVRELKKIGVEIFFEQESLRTMDGTSEMILTVLSMVAQEESHIKSEAMNSSIEIRFGLGMFLTPALLGYDHIGPGELQLNYSESLTVKKMYYMLLNGYSTNEIADELMRLNRPTKLGRYKLVR
jgi:Site-specific recombinases, DNA invertase Pin homologs